MKRKRLRSKRRMARLLMESLSMYDSSLFSLSERRSPGVIEAILSRAL